jgi:hypothetical protein
LPGTKIPIPHVGRELQTLIVTVATNDKQVQKSTIILTIHKYANLLGCLITHIISMSSAAFFFFSFAFLSFKREEEEGRLFNNERKAKEKRKKAYNILHLKPLKLQIHYL